MSIIPDIEREIERQVALLHRIHVGGRSLLQPGGINDRIGEKEEPAFIRMGDELGAYIKPHGSHRLFHGGEMPRRVLRVEICRDHEWELHDYAIRNLGQHDPYRNDGCQRIHGVDVYIVNRLPAPGWRVINPLEKMR